MLGCIGTSRSPLWKGKPLWSPHMWSIISYTHLLYFSNDLLYWKARGRIGFYAILQMVSILCLASLYGVLILHRATLGHVGRALKAMGLHCRRIQSMDPHNHSKIARGSLLGWGGCTWPIMPHRAPDLHHTLGRWSRTSKMMWHHPHHHPIPWGQPTGIFDLFGDPWGHLCAPRCYLEHHRLLQGANPLPIAFEGPSHHYGNHGPH